jgi:hypothetical protein
MTTGGQGKNPPIFSLLAFVPAPFFLFLLGTKTLASISAVVVLATFVLMYWQPSSTDHARPVAKYFKSMLPVGNADKDPTGQLILQR